MTAGVGRRGHYRRAVIGGATKRIRTGREQSQRHIADARFAEVLRSVAVRVVPHRVTNSAGLRLVVTEIRIQVDAVGRQIH